MAVPVISRARWGAKPWRGPTPHRVSPKERTEFFSHYHGAPPPAQLGFAVPRNVEAIHRANGWSGTGYNFMVDVSGYAYEGRGWDLVGAHCPNHNRQGIGVYVAIGGNQKPSPAALHTVRRLYDEACERSGRALAKKGHRDGKATACPGDPLYDWVREGMPVPGLDPTPRAIGDGQDAGRPLLALGTRGRHVEALQVALTRVGYAHLMIDGDFGPATQRTLVDFQVKNGLTPDGIAGQATYAKLSELIPDDNPLTIHEEDHMQAQLITPGDRTFYLATAHGGAFPVNHEQLTAYRAAGLVREPGRLVAPAELDVLLQRHIEVTR